MHTASRRILVVVGAIALLTPVASADAFQTGNYRGGKASTRVTSISFRAAQGLVKNLQFNIKSGPSCTDGSGINDSSDGYDFSRRPIRRGGRFSGNGTFVGSTAFAFVEIRGRLLTEGRARGVLHSEVTFTAGPRAGVKCDTGEVPWFARR